MDRRKFIKAAVAAAIPGQTAAWVSLSERMQALQPIAVQASSEIQTNRDLTGPSALYSPARFPAFIPLSPGAVQPLGWLRDWALSAAEGITGHLDEYCATFHEAWRGYSFPAMGERPDGTGWPLEQCSYWLDGAVRLGYILQDSQLLQKASSRLDLVVNGVLNGGETFIYWRPKSAVADPFNSWAHSHMGRALVGYYQGSRDPKVLAALVKVYQRYPLDKLPSGFETVSGAVNVDAMMETYRFSSDELVRNNILTFARTSAYNEVSEQWARKDVHPGHNVIFHEHIRVPALLYQWTANKRDLLATTAALEWNDENNLLPMGVSSGEEYQAGVGSTRNVETCNISASMWTYIWLARITGNSSYLERVEKIFFNAGPAPVGRDFRIMSYYQSANRYSHSAPREEPRNPGPGSYQFTDIGYPVLCCVGNINRVIPFYVMHMWMATADGGLAATLWGPAKVETTVRGNIRVKVETKTAYPFDETLEIKVIPDQPVRFPIYLRIPAWTEAPEILLNGQSIAVERNEAGYHRLTREWKQGDIVRLRFPMSVTILKGYETSYPQIDYFKDGRELAQIKNIHTPYASVYYGPLLFALPIPDKTPNQEIPGTRFNYAITLQSDRPRRTEAEAIRVLGGMPERWDWPLTSPLQLGIDAEEISWTPTENQPLPRRITGGTATRIVLVPYGCTKFRVSMFPRPA